MAKKVLKDRSKKKPLYRPPRMLRNGIKIFQKNWGFGELESLFLSADQTDDG